ncbi:MAG: hypothetical protein AAAB35_18130 [Phyllobacterium sp.]|uniref:hypothetical protein n=1 Tax=Phyllobacterium sp. TaxID=1871046 RepID=UPI0030F12A8D
MNILTLAREALIARLSTITVENGYHTHAGGNVRGGWLNEVIKAADISYPLIVVQKAKGLAPVAGPHAIKVLSGFNVIGAVDAGLDGYESAVEDLEHDLIRCLMTTAGQLPDWLPRGVPMLAIGAPESFPPADGSKAALVLIPVYLHTIIQGKFP